ncbi:MAG: imidazole glycerol phosphate synthase subunit HisF [Acidobacteria bacterium RIFCSPLOWO2_12_FULL_54_10]|nr:MAG: imidazole glycerol phosphate synthase subunit HisF [Acidobacteria bacterium RIFCSPLOWO2_12_FULL_54_10]
MLAKRVIACLDVKDGRVVKGIQFLDLRDAGDPAELAAAYNREGVDEVIFLDITASAEKRALIVETVARTARQVFIPLAVGGGIRSVADARGILLSGADKVSVNTAAVENPVLITQLSEEFGSQAVVLAIDARRNGDSWSVYTYGGRKLTDRNAIEWAAEGESLGAGEILLTSMDCDGTQNGFDCALTKAISRAVMIPVIASGGAGNAEHFAQVLTEGEADAALAASIFHYGTVRVSDLKRHLRSQGITVRL